MLKNEKTIKDLQDEIEKLKREITSALAEFQLQTGSLPSKVDINLIDTSTVSQRGLIFLDSVDVIVEI